MSLIAYRGCVNAWECDQWGHQNVRFYVAKASQSQAVLCCELGLTPSWLREHGLAPMATRHRMLFRRELRAGDPVYIRSGVRGADGRQVRYWSVLTHAETEAESAVFDTELALVDRATGTPIEIPAHVVTRAAELASSVEYPEPPPITGPRPATSAPAAGILTHRGMIGQAECDESGWTAPEDLVIHFTQAMTHLMASLGLPRATLLARNIGYAAVDHVVAYHAPLKPGNLVDMRSGVLEMRSKVLRVFHHVIDTGRGEFATTLEVALVFFDLTARKSIPMPEEVVQRAPALMPAAATPA